MDNRVDQEFVLTVTITSEKGQRLALRSLPVQRSSAGDSGKRWRYLDADSLNFDFDRLAVRAVLVSVPQGRDVGSAAAFWPGDAGMSSGASSHRILVVLTIDTDDRGAVRLRFHDAFI